MTRLILTLCSCLLISSAVATPVNSNINITSKTIRLAASAYQQIDTDYKSLTTSDLHSAFIKYSLNKPSFSHTSKTPETTFIKDSYLVKFIDNILTGKSPNFDEALSTALTISDNKFKSRALLSIAEKQPKGNRLLTLTEAKKVILGMDTKQFFFNKEEKLFSLAKMYFESGFGKNTDDIRSSIHELQAYLLFQYKHTKTNAIYFGKVAELESQLGIPPNDLCKLTSQSLDKQHQATAFSRITASYLSNDYNNKVCMPIEELLQRVSTIPDPINRISELLILGEAFHKASKDDKTLSNLYADVIKLFTDIDRSTGQYKLGIQIKIMMSLLKTNQETHYKFIYNDFWEHVNSIKQPYQQSEPLMQLSFEAFLADHFQLSLDALHKISETSLKVTSGIQLARLAHKNDNHDFAAQSINESFQATIKASHPIQKIGYLTDVLSAAHDLGKQEIAEDVLDRTAKSLSATTNTTIKAMYGMKIANYAWALGKKDLADDFLNTTSQWNQNKAADPNTQIELIKANILLGKNNQVLSIVDKLSGKNLKARALVYAAITLAKKQNKDGYSTNDDLLTNGIKLRIEQLKGVANERNTPNK